MTAESAVYQYRNRSRWQRTATLSTLSPQMRPAAQPLQTLAAVVQTMRRTDAGGENMKSKICIVIGLTIAASAPAMAQEHQVTSSKPLIAKNALYVELGGNGVGYTLNYERRIAEQASLRVGGMFWKASATASSGGDSVSSSATMAIVPVMANFLGLGTANHKLEVGAGVAMAYFSGEASNSIGDKVSGTGMVPMGTATLGYRYQPRDGGFLFRAGYTPVFNKDFVFHWGGVSFGYGF
jgi:hypothetical protein